MAIKKSELYTSLWKSCDELRGGMDASQYKDYVLVLLFVKYVSDKAASQTNYLLDVPEATVAHVLLHGVAVEAHEHSSLGAWDLVDDGFEGFEHGLFAGLQGRRRRPAWQAGLRGAIAPARGSPLRGF